MKKMLVLLILFPRLAVATGVEVSPSQIMFDQKLGQTRQTIEVTNPSSETQLFTVYFDEFGELFKVSPSGFELPPHTSRQVDILLSDTGSESFVTNLSIVGAPETVSLLGTKTGIKIRAVVIDTEHNAATRNWMSYFLAGVIIVLILELLWYIKGQKS